MTASIAPPQPDASYRPQIVRVSGRAKGAELAVAALLFAVALLLQVSSGAYRGAFGAEPDEAAHYVTALMVKEYLAEGMPRDPVAFASDYYLHYPRVAFGLWPPLFHIGLGVAMYFLGAGREVILALMALAAALWGYAVFRIVRNEFGLAAGIVTALFVVAHPVTQRNTSAVMLDVPLAVLITLASVAFARYMRSGETRDSVKFSLFAAAAILTKYNGLLLAFVPLFAVGLTCRFDLLRKRNFWGAAALTGALTAPWYVAQFDLVSYASEHGSGPTARWQNTTDNLSTLVATSGPALVVCAILGALLMLVRPLRQRFVSAEASHRGLDIYAVAASVIISACVFHGAVCGYAEPRYLLPALPYLVILALVPFRELCRTHPSGHRLTPALAGGFVAVMPLAPAILSAPPKNTESFVEVSNHVLGYPLPTPGVVMVSSDAAGEGMFVAEMAMRAPRSKMVVVRASKILADRHLMGSDYRLIYDNSADLMRALDAVPVSLVVLENCDVSRCGEHTALIWRATRDFAHRWARLNTISGPDGRQLYVYRLKGNEYKPLATLSVDLSRTIGRVLTLKGPDEVSRSRDRD